MTASELALVDSSGWLEYLTGDTKAEAFGKVLLGSVQVLVPTVVLYEVFKVLLLRASKANADLFLSEALRRKVVDLTDTIALAAASYSVDCKLRDSSNSARGVNHIGHAFFGTRWRDYRLILGSPSSSRRRHGLAR